MRQIQRATDLPDVLGTDRIDDVHPRKIVIASKCTANVTDRDVIEAAKRTDRSAKITMFQTLQRFFIDRQRRHLLAYVIDERFKCRCLLCLGIKQQHTVVRPQIDIRTDKVRDDALIQPSLILRVQR